MSLRPTEIEMTSRRAVVPAYKRPQLNSALLDIVATQYKIPNPFCESLSSALGNASMPITFVVIDIENYPNFNEDPRFMLVMQNKTSHFVVTASYNQALLKKLDCTDQALLKKLDCTERQVFCDNTVKHDKDAADTHLIMLAQTMFILSNFNNRMQDKFVIFSNDHVFRNMACVMDSNFYTWTIDKVQPSDKARVSLCSGLARRADANAPLAASR